MGENILGLIADESDPNPVSTMPGDFCTPGEFDLVGGLLCLKFPGNAFGQMGTAAKG